MTLRQAEQRASDAIVAAIGADHPLARGTYTNRMLKQYRAAYDAIDKEIASIYTNYLTGVKPSEYYTIMSKIRPGQQARITRLEYTRREIAKIYNRYAKGADRITANASAFAINQQYYANQYAMNWFLDRPVFVKIPTAAVNVSVYGMPKYWHELTVLQRAKYKNLVPPSGTLTSTLLNKNRLGLRRINNAITQGITNGWGYRKTAKLVQKAINTTATHAIQIVRTESHRNQGAGAYANTQALRGEGIDIVREWLHGGSRDPRGDHVSLSGTLEDRNGLWHLSELSAAFPGSFGDPAEDINCSCDVLDIIDDEHPNARAGRNPQTGEMEIMNFDDYPQWAVDNGLTSSQYSDIK